MEKNKNKIVKKPTRKTGGFDAIKIMREIRDKISQEILNMTLDEEKAYLKKLIADGKLKTD